MKTRTNTELPLFLLDDSGSQAGPDAFAWTQLTNKYVAAIVSAAAATALQKAQKALAVADHNSAGRIFSSSPTLRQMMGEYNRSSGGMSPLRVTAPRSSSEGFSYDRVDFIDLPSIPGKILRPSQDFDPDADA